MLPSPQETADMVTFTEENLKGKLVFVFVLLFYLESCFILLA